MNTSHVIDADYPFPAFTMLLVPSTKEVQEISKNAGAKVRTRNFKHIRRLYENHSVPHTSSTDLLEHAWFEKLLRIAWIPESGEPVGSRTGDKRSASIPSPLATSPLATVTPVPTRPTPLA